MQCPKCGNAMFLLLYTHKCYACEDAKKAKSEAEKKVAETPKEKYTYYTLEGPQPYWDPWGNLTWTIPIWDDLALAKDVLMYSEPGEYIIQIHCDEKIKTNRNGYGVVAFTKDYTIQHSDKTIQVYVVRHGGKVTTP